MKKLLLAVVLGYLLVSTNAFSADGTVKEIQQYKDGVTAVVFTVSGVDTNNIVITGDAETQKRHVAMLLTAKTTGATVTFSNCLNAGVFGLCTLIYQ